jgi:hypothetical protein
MKKKAMRFDKSFSGESIPYYGTEFWRLRAFATDGKKLPFDGIKKIDNVRIHLHRDAIRVRKGHVAIDIPADMLRSALRQAGVIK